MDGVGAGGPAGGGGSTEVGAVVPERGGQGAGQRGIVGDGGSGPGGGEELREVGDVGELRTQKQEQIDAWSATASWSLCIFATVLPFSCVLLQRVANFFIRFYSIFGPGICVRYWHTHFPST